MNERSAGAADAAGTAGAEVAGAAVVSGAAGAAGAAVAEVAGAVVAAGAAGNAIEHGRNEQELETYGAAVCRHCGAELPALAECYPTECARCGGRRFYAIREMPRRRSEPDKAAFLPDVGVIDDYTL